MFGQHEDVGEITEGGLVCDDPGEGDLLAVEMGSEAQGVVDGPLQVGEGNAEAPVGLFTEETVNGGTSRRPLSSLISSARSVVCILAPCRDEKERPLRGGLPVYSNHDLRPA